MNDGSALIHWSFFRIMLTWAPSEVRSNVNNIGKIYLCRNPSRDSPKSCFPSSCCTPLGAKYWLHHHHPGARSDFCALLDRQCFSNALFPKATSPRIRFRESKASQVPSARQSQSLSSPWIWNHKAEAQSTFLVCTMKEEGCLREMFQTNSDFVIGFLVNGENFVSSNKYAIASKHK